MCVRKFSLVLAALFSLAVPGAMLSPPTPSALDRNPGLKAWAKEKQLRALGLLFGSPGLLALGFQAGESIPPSPAKDPDEQFLQESKVSTDGPGLLHFLGQRSAHDEDLLQLDRLIRQLAAADFQLREQTSRKLIALGPPTHAPLRQAQKDKDQERARRAKDCAEQINKNWNPGINLAVVRRLVKIASSLSPGGRGQGEGDVAHALLQFLPYAADEECEEEIWFGLDTLAKKQPPPVGQAFQPDTNDRQAGKPDLQRGPAWGAIAEFVTDKFPIRRAAAGYLLARRGNADQRAAGKKLLADPDPIVRLRTAQGLLGAKDKDAVPVLIDLLETLRWVEEAWQAEEMLHWIAGDDAPEQTMGAGSTEARENCRKAWQQWWQANATKVDLAKLNEEYCRPGLILLGTSNGDATKAIHNVSLIGCDGRSRWQLELLASDMQLLPADRILVTQREDAGEPQVKRAKAIAFVTGVSERDLNGKVLWRYGGKSASSSAHRLPNGNTLLVDRYFFGEIAPDGSEIKPPLIGPVEDGLMFFADWAKLANGYVVGLKEAGRGLEAIGHFDQKTGRLVRKVNLQHRLEQAKVEPLPNSQYLIASWISRRVIEADASGRTVWDFKTFAPIKALRLRNGNTLIGCDVRVVEITPAGKMVSEILLPGGVNHVHIALGLVRLGFDTPRPSDLDLATSIPYRVKGLASKDAFVRYHSARALEALGPKAEEAIPELIRAMDDPDVSVQGALGGALGAIGAPALPSLIQATSDRRSSVRLLAVRTLHGFQNQSKVVVPILITRLSDNDVLVRREAVSCLSHFAPQAPEMIPALIEALKDKDTAKNLQEMSVSQIAVQTLREFGPKAKAAIPALIDTLMSQDVYLRGYTIVALGKIGPEAKVAIPAILNVLRTKGAGNSEEAVYTRWCVAACLADIGGPEAEAAIPALIEVLKNKDLHPVYRQCAAKALAKIGPKAASAVPALKAAVHDKDDQVHAEALKALKAISPKP